MEYIPFDRIGPLWSPEQAAAAHEAWIWLYETVWLPLQVPDFSIWQGALQQALYDWTDAVMSASHFWFLTLRPFVLLISMVLQFVGGLVWKYVIVKGISQQGVHYVTTGTVRLYRLQMSLTPRELMLEGAAVLGIVALYYLRRFLKRQTYFKRFSAWTKKKVLAVRVFNDRMRHKVVKVYEGTVRRIASTSLVLAMMTPHLVFASGVVAGRVIFPEFCQWLACETSLLAVVKIWYPLLATILLIHDYRMAKKEEQSAEKATESPKKASAKTRRTSPEEAVRQQKRQQAKEMGEREGYWLRYWMVHAAAQGLKTLLCAMPFLTRFVSKYEWLQVGLVQSEHAFYVWIFAVPFILPQIPSAPEARPLFLLAPRIGKLSVQVYRSADVFTDEWWNSFIVRPCGVGFDVIVMMRIISRPMADSLRDLVVQGKSLLVPAMTLFFPRFISIFGLLFVQYAFPLQKQHRMPRPRTSMLSYWTVHCLFTMILDATASILWWIPLSRAVTFAAFLLLGSWQSLVEFIVNMIQHDLEIFHILPSTEDGSSDSPPRQSWTGRSLQILLERLPKAKDESTEVSEVPPTISESEERPSTSTRTTADDDAPRDPAPSTDKVQVVSDTDDALIYPSSDEDGEGSGSSVEESTDKAYTVESRKRDSTIDKENRKNEMSSHVRRSTRQRKKVSYTS